MAKLTVKRNPPALPNRQRKSRKIIPVAKKVKSKIKLEKTGKNMKKPESSTDDSDGDLDFTNNSDGSLSPAEELAEDIDQNHSADDGNDSEGASDEEGDAGSNDSEGASDQGDADSDAEMDPEKHKKSLEKLKNTDPDFYSFLAQNDKNLLNFDMDSSDGEGDDDKEDNGMESVHEPGPMQGDSDESDFEPEDGSADVSGKRITLTLISQWQEELKSAKIKVGTITSVIQAFNAAMLRVTDSKDREEGIYKVEGSSVFNAVVQICVLYLQPALKQYLGMETSGKDPQKCKHFVKINKLLISYLGDLVKLLSGVTSTNILTVLLKHLHQMSVFVACFSRISKQLLKKLIVLWSTAEETVRVLAFLCILRITRNQQSTLLDSVLKTMYMTYVKNCKFVSPSTWPGIHFMRRSLVEMYSLDLNVSYQHVFLYIRQLAIHLRNAIVVQKIENRQAVYNWQFVNSMHLWGDLLGATCNKPQLQPLVYPLVMIISNTIKLVPTQQYYPLRFHCVEILINLSKSTGTFIPIIPYLLEVLTNYDFNKRNKKVSMKPLDFSCILRLSKSQLTENGFKDSVIEKVYGLLLEYSANESSSISFPDLVILPILQLKQFLKTCTVSNYTRKLRQLLDKIEENARFMEKERKLANFSLNDTKVISAWETTISNKGTPLSTFYDNWYKINRIQKKKKITKNDELAENLPMIKKVKKDTEIKKATGPVELFPSDSEEDEVKIGSDDNEMTEKREKKVKKKDAKKSKQVKEVDTQPDDDDIADNDDIVQEIDVKDW